MLSLIYHRQYKEFLAFKSASEKKKLQFFVKEDSIKSHLYNPFLINPSCKTKCNNKKI